jgi:glucosamine--fructose-6-phosphate aminotransferase (isomerizing)
MCGIVGIIGTRPAAERIVDALRRLEYRGYDSAGVATLSGGAIQRRRVAGKLYNLERAVDEDPPSGDTGIGHTRWATHGAPTDANAHPHVAGRVAIVHNGIIENHMEIRAELAAAGVIPESDTDTEVVACLFETLLNGGLSPEDAMRRLVERVTGAFAFVIMIADRPDLLLVARRASPLAIGYGYGEMYVGSDALALAQFTRRIAYLDDGDWAVISRDGAQVFDASGAAVERAVRLSEVSGALIGKGNYRHFMEKEIHEQPEVVGYTLHRYLDPGSAALSLPEMPFDPATVPKLTIVAAGTSSLAGMVARYWFEGTSRLATEVDIASEFRYRDAVLPPGGVALFISQSGESLDTLMALRHAREQGQFIVSLVNVPESTIARESDAVLMTRAGPEIGVASTKAFTTQLIALACLALDWGVKRGVLAEDRLAELSAALAHVPTQIAQVLGDEAKLSAIAHELSQARDILYLGRGTSYPIALEGALKLKEISYIHAEGYAAGEMKHGPIALIDEDVPVIVVAPPDQWFEKTAGNLREVLARGGKVVFLSDADGIARMDGDAAHMFEMPTCDPFTAPILYALPVQLLAYHTALEKGTDVDQPRNLAKSVTVE